MRVARSSGFDLRRARACTASRSAARASRPRARTSSRDRVPWRGRVVHADDVLEVRRLGAHLGDLLQPGPRSRRRRPWPRCRSGCRAPGPGSGSGRWARRRPPRTAWRGRRRPTPGGSRRGWRRGRPSRCRGARRPIESSSTARRNSSELMSRQAPSLFTAGGRASGRCRPSGRRCRRGCASAISSASPPRGHAQRAPARADALAGSGSAQEEVHDGAGQLGEIIVLAGRGSRT